MFSALPPKPDIARQSRHVRLPAAQVFRTLELSRRQISNGGDQSSGQHRTDAGSFIEPHAHFVGSVPGADQPVELQDLLLDPPQLSPECRETRTSYLWNSLVVWIGYDIEQLLDTVTPDRCNDPELGKMGPDCIDHRGLLTDEQMTRAVQHQAALLLGSLGRHEPHVGPGDRLANGLCIRRPFALLGLPATSNPDGLTRYLSSARTKQLGLDIVVV